MFEARVINKSEINYASGKVVKLLLIDEHKEMRCVIFNENIDLHVDKFEVFIYIYNI